MNAIYKRGRLNHKLIVGLILVLWINHIILPGDNVSYAADNMTVTTEVKEEITGSILIREGNENGTVVADLGIGEKPKLIPGKEYYLCVLTLVNQPVDDKINFVEIAFGELQKDGTYLPNGLVFTKVPGDLEKPGKMNHDSFSELISRNDAVNPNNCDSIHEMNDGSYRYQIKEEKCQGGAIYFAVGFQVDSTYWNNQLELGQVMHLAIGTQDANGQNEVSHHNDYSIRMNQQYVKKYSHELDIKSAYTVSVDRLSKEVTSYIAGPNNMVCEEASYLVSYPVYTDSENESNKNTISLKNQQCYESLCQSDMTDVAQSVETVKENLYVTSERMNDRVRYEDNQDFDRNIVNNTT